MPPPPPIEVVLSQENTAALPQMVNESLIIGWSTPQHTVQYLGEFHDFDDERGVFLGSQLRISHGFLPERSIK